MKRLILTVFVLSLFTSLEVNGAGNSNSANNANVCLHLDPQAAIVGFDDFWLYPIGSDGANDAIYQGQDEVRIESNVQIGIRLQGGNLSNGHDEIQTDYLIDGNTQVNVRNKHDFSNDHMVSAEVRLGRTSDQLRGVYKAQVVLTIIALHPNGQGPNTCAGT
jgi:hypothetical protein